MLPTGRPSPPAAEAVAREMHMKTSVTHAARRTCRAICTPPVPSRSCRTGPIRASRSRRMIGPRVARDLSGPSARNTYVGELALFAAGRRHVSGRRRSQAIAMRNTVVTNAANRARRAGGLGRRRRGPVPAPLAARLPGGLPDRPRPGRRRGHRAGGLPLRAARARPLRPAAALRPWLHRIVVNRAIDWSRARALRREVGELRRPRPADPPGAASPSADDVVPALW